MGHGDVMGFEHFEDALLVLERVDAVIQRTTVAAKIDRQDVAIALDVDVPRGAPTRLPFSSGSRGPRWSRSIHSINCGGADSIAAS